MDDDQAYLEVDLFFFDTTSTCFERDEDEDDTAEQRGSRKYGKSRITATASCGSSSGSPSFAKASRREWCWPGITNAQQVKDDMRDWKVGGLITVVDRGFSTADNLA